MRPVALQYVIRNGEHNLIYGHIKQTLNRQLFLEKARVQMFSNRSVEFGIVNSVLKAKAFTGLPVVSG